MKLRKETKEAVHQILDVFSGADGGGDFMAFRLLMEDMDAQAAKGDQAADTLVKQVLQFSRLLRTARKYYGGASIDL